MEYTIDSIVLNDWKIVRAIGEGAFGKVFEIQKNDYGITTRSALKVIRVPRSQADIRAALADGMDEKTVTSYFQGFVEEIVKEIAIMSSLKSHPGIVSCEDHKVIPHADNIGWDILIRMELLQPLTDYQLSHTMDESAVRKLAMDLTSALSFCQTKALIHRDIKPENIFVSETGQFKLGDFGVARTAEKTTGGLSKKGTESYMAPEVYLARPYGATVDIYSLGLVLYKFMNYNRLPFLPPYPAPITFADRENSMVQRMQGVQLPPPAAASSELTDIILKACAFDPQQRYQSAADMLADLQKLEALPSSAAPTAAPVQEASPQDQSAYADQTVGIWGRNSNEPTESTVGIWNTQSQASTPSFRNDPPEPSYAPSTPQPSYTSQNSYIPPTYQVPPTGQVPPAGRSTEPPIPSYIPIPPAPPKKKGVSKLLIGGIAAAVVVVIVAVVVLISLGTEPEPSYQAYQEESSSSYYDSFDESSVSDWETTEESSYETEETVQETLVLDEDAQLWDDAMTEMFDPIEADYLTATGLDLLSSDGLTPDFICSELVANGFLFLQEDGSYDSTPYYFDAYHNETGSADLKYCAALPPGGHTFQRTRDVGKIYVVTDSAMSNVVYLKWIWAYDNADTEAILGDTAFSSFLPWTETLGTWQFDEALNNSYTDYSMHNWLKEQPDVVSVHNFDLAYFITSDPENVSHEVSTLMISPNENYMAATGQNFAWIDLTLDDVTPSNTNYSLTIVYDGSYDPFNYSLVNFWEPALNTTLSTADEEFQYQWTLAVNNALEHLEDTLGVSTIDYNASLTDLYDTFRAQADGSYGMTELLSDDTWDYFLVAHNSASIFIYDEKNPEAGSFHRDIAFYYEPECETAAEDLAFINSYLPPVGYQLGQTPADTYAAFGVSADLYNATSETLSYTWNEMEPTPEYEYQLYSMSAFFSEEAAYHTDTWLEKDVLNHHRLRLKLGLNSTSSNRVDFESAHFNDSTVPTVYKIQYTIQR